MSDTNKRPNRVPLWGYAKARLKEPVTWVSIGVLVNMVRDNWHHLFTLHSAVQIGGAVCGILIRSPGSPWQTERGLLESEPEVAHIGEPPLPPNLPKTD